jgi:hypothetical protein
MKRLLICLLTLFIHNGPRALDEVITNSSYAVYNDDTPNDLMPAYRSSTIQVKFFAFDGEIVSCECCRASASIVPLRPKSAIDDRSPLSPALVALQTQKTKTHNP